MSSTCSPVSEGSRSASSDQGCEPSHSARLTPIAGASSADTGRACRSIGTSPRPPASVSAQTEFPWTSSPAASRVRTLALPDPAPVSPARDPDYGPSSPVFLARFDLASRSWRTCQGSFLEMTGDGLAAFSGTWPRSGSMRNGTAYRLPPLARLTDGIASGLLPTPCAIDPGSRFNQSRSPGAALRPTLGAMARFVMFPTPTAGDAKSSGSRNLPGSKANAGVSLTDFVRTGGSTTPRQIPTPTARDYRHQNAVPSSQPGRGTQGEQLPNFIGGPLNPTWVEWLMGFPDEWTASEHWVTRSSRKFPKSSGEQS